MRRCFRFAPFLALALIGCALCACAHLPGQAPPSQPPAKAQGVSAAIAPAREYRIGPGDALRFEIDGTGALLGDAKVGADGIAVLPRAGKTKLAGLTLSAAAAAVNKRSDAKASVTLLDPPKIYIAGAVVSPGAIVYRKGLTLGGLIALAGGATYKADLRKVEIKARHAQSERQTPYRAALPILPGDVVRVEERWF